MTAAQFRRFVNTESASYQAYERDEKYFISDKRQGRLRRLTVNKTTALRYANQRDAQFAHDITAALNNAERTNDIRLHITHE